MPEEITYEELQELFNISEKMAQELQTFINAGERLGLEMLDTKRLLAKWEEAKDLPALLCVQAC